jgi:hypothetical protein
VSQFTNHREIFLVAFLHYEPFALFVGETECARSSGFRHLTAGSIHVAKDLSALPDEHHAPGAQEGFCFPEYAKAAP